MKCFLCKIRYRYSLPLHLFVPLSNSTPSGHAQTTLIFGPGRHKRLQTLQDAAESNQDIQQLNMSFYRKAKCMYEMTRSIKD